MPGPGTRRGRRQAVLPAPGIRRLGPARAVRHVEEAGEASREGLDDGCGANRRWANVARGCRSR